MPSAAPLPLKICPAVAPWKRTSMVLRAAVTCSAVRAPAPDLRAVSICDISTPFISPDDPAMTHYAVAARPVQRGWPRNGNDDESSPRPPSGPPSATADGLLPCSGGQELGLLRGELLVGQDACGSW